MQFPGFWCGGATILLAALSAATTAAADSPGTPPDGIEAALQPFVDSHSLAGAVTLVADRDRVLSLHAVGFADIAARHRMRADALFWIASQSKPITATALMMLVEEGLVRLDDPVSSYLPEFADLWVAEERDDHHARFVRPAHAPTVREILSHTSGLPFRSRIEEPTLDALPLRTAVLSYAMTPLESQPGTKYQYSNAGTNTAGRIIEVVSGMPYQAFLQRRLFDPLGMSDTTFWPSKSQQARIAKSYKPDSAGTGLEETTIAQLHYPLDDHARYPMPAGGLFSTAVDVGLFCRMILNGGELEGKRYLTRASISEMTRKQTGDALSETYGLGWSTGDTGYGHGGAYATNMSINPASGLVTVFLVQHAGFPGNGAESGSVFQKIAEIKFGRK